MRFRRRIGDVGSRIDAYRDRFVASSRVLLASVWGAVSLVLLVACASAASVLVARGAARTGEFAIRVALGATRADLLAQVLTESLLLAVVAGTAGILAALWGLPAVVALMPPDLPHAVDFSFNWRALVVALSSAVATGILGGIAPAWQAGRISSCSTANAAVTRAVARPKLRAALVVGQLARRKPCSSAPVSSSRRWCICSERIRDSIPRVWRRATTI